MECVDVDDFLCMHLSLSVCNISDSELQTDSLLHKYFTKHYIFVLFCSTESSMMGLVSLKWTWKCISDLRFPFQLYHMLIKLFFFLSFTFYILSLALFRF